MILTDAQLTTFSKLQQAKYIGYPAEMIRATFSDCLDTIRDLQRRLQESEAKQVTLTAALDGLKKLHDSCWDACCKLEEERNQLQQQLAVNPQCPRGHRIVDWVEGHFFCSMKECDEPYVVYKCDICRESMHSHNAAPDAHISKPYCRACRELDTVERAATEKAWNDVIAYANKRMWDGAVSFLKKEMRERNIAITTEPAELRSGEGD